MRDRVAPASTLLCLLGIFLGGVLPAQEVVVTEDNQPVLLDPLGMRVVQTEPGLFTVREVVTPLPDVDIVPGDVIVGVNDAEITSLDALRRVVTGVRPGERVVLRVRRNDAVRPVTFVVPESRPMAAATATVRPEYEILGMQLAAARAGRVVVTAVAATSPADVGGVRPGDILTRVETHNVADLRQLATVFEALFVDRQPGSIINLQLTRGDAVVAARVVVPNDAAVRVVPAARAVVTNPAPAPVAVQAPTRVAPVVVFCMEVRNYVAGGALVLNVMNESPAAAAGIRAGDVIRGVGDRAVNSTDDLAQAVLTLQRGDRAAFTIYRGGEQRAVEVTMAPCEYTAPPRGPADLEAIEAQLRTLRAQVEEVQRTIEVLSYTVDRLRAE